MVSVWPQWWQPVGGPRDKIWDLVALVWPIRSRVITTSSALVRCWNFFGGPVLVSQDRDLCQAQLHPTLFEPTSECKSWAMVSYLYSGHLPVGLCLGRGSSFASWSTLSFSSMPQWLGTQQKRTRVSLSLNDQSRFMIWQIKGFSVSSPLIACKQDIESE